MIVGIDEVGRGCWAGPVVAGAVLLDKRMTGLRDSKLLTKLQRERLDIKIRAKALAFGIGWATPLEIDTLGLTAAVGLAMHRALEQIAAPYDQIIIDGNYNFMAANPKALCQIKADNTVAAVSAASIIAKVARDKYMATEMAVDFPDYQFEQHVGYGTKAHAAAIAKHGVCAIHRRSFAPIRTALELKAA